MNDNNTIIYKTTLAWSSSISSLKWLKKTKQKYKKKNKATRKEKTIVNQEQNCESIKIIATTLQQIKLLYVQWLPKKYIIMWFHTSLRMARNSPGKYGLSSQLLCCTWK